MARGNFFERWLNILKGFCYFLHSISKSNITCQASSPKRYFWAFTITGLQPLLYRSSFQDWCYNYFRKINLTYIHLSIIYFLRSDSLSRPSGRTSIIVIFPMYRDRLCVLNFFIIACPDLSGDVSYYN
jgi:hypothetical protein